MTIYAPLYQTICEAIETSPEALSKPGKVTVPNGLLRLLLKYVISDLHIDARLYLKLNPDLAKAYEGKSIKDVENHFKTAGYFEMGRNLPIRFDELYYLRSNPDVKAAVDAKRIESGAAHYFSSGVYELRSPNADVEGEVAEWKSILTMAPATR